MITKWKILDHLQNNKTTFRFWTNNEDTDIDYAEYLISKYVSIFGYDTDGIIKLKFDDEVFFEIITTLPFSIFKKNNDFFKFISLNDLTSAY